MIGQEFIKLLFLEFIYDVDHRVGWKTIVGGNCKDGIPFRQILLRTIGMFSSLCAIELRADNFVL